MSYTEINWKSYPDTSTPVSGENLKHMDEGIKTNDTAITALTSRATTLESRATELESRATAVEDRATELESRATELEAKGEALWTNPDTTVAFAGQTTDIWDRDYKFVLVYYIDSDPNDIKTAVIFKGTTINVKSQGSAYSRAIVNNGTSVTFGDVWLDGITQNGLYIPVAVYGII